MAIDINNTDIPTAINEGAVKFNAVNVQKVVFNDITVWYHSAASEELIFTSSASFTVPFGITEVLVCMCGGGGAGKSDNNSFAGGGYRGGIISGEVVAVTEFEVMQVVVGLGGLGVSGGSDAGRPGTESTFGGLVAAGGRGGDSSGYGGNGASFISPCDGVIYKDGRKVSDGAGGQAGAFGNGGNLTSDGQPGGIGAGGGGNDGSAAGGRGGRGQVIIKW